MKNLKELSSHEIKLINGGGVKLPIGLGGILLIFDAIDGYMDGIEEAYYEKNPPKDTNTEKS